MKLQYFGHLMPRTDSLENTLMLGQIVVWKGDWENDRIYKYIRKNKLLNFHGGSNGKESACNAGDWDLIPGLGRSHGEVNDNPFQYFCVQSSRTREAWWAVVHGVSKSQTGLSSYPFHFWNVFKGFLEREKKHTFQIKKTPPFSSYITLLNLDKILI